MPEKCIDRYHCGTHDPVWFMGKHPTKQGEETMGKACANTGFGANCCGYEIGAISVRHCGAFFVYRLLRIQGCSFAYCAASYPPMTGNPILSGPITSGLCPDGQRYTDFFFTCTVGYLNSMDSNVAFDIEFLIDGKPSGIEKHISSLQRDATIYAIDLHIFRGHEFDPGRLELDEKNRSPTELKVVSTIPIACKNCSDRAMDCCYEMDLYSYNVTSACHVKLCYTDWNDATKSAVTTTHVEADKDFFNSDKTGYIKPVPFRSEEVNSILSDNYTPLPVQVGTKNSPAAVCFCHGEPHCLTFDRNNAGMAHTTWTDAGFYDMYHVGMFTMVQTKATPSYIPEFQVQIQTQTCWNVACICGVVARERTDVVSFNTCDLKFGSNTISEKILFPDQFSNLTIVQESGKSYMIYFPSGRWVKVDKNDANMTRVEVQVLSDDANNVEGLCGEYSGHPDRLGKTQNGNPIPFARIPDSFIESNRIMVGSSMYEQSYINYSTPPNSTRLCDCTGDDKGWHIDCNPIKGQIQQSSTFNTRLPNNRNITKALLARSKVHNHSAGSYPFQQHFHDTAFVPITPTWPTKGGLYEADARRKCQDAVNGVDTLVQCKSVANIDFGALIETCVEDIKVTSDVTFASRLTHVAMSMCVEAVVKNPILFHLGKSPQLDFLRNRPCPGDCTGHGTCTHGNCSCNFGFDGTDCSVDTTKSPIINRVDSQNPCDIQQSRCGLLYLSISNFIHSDNSLCHLRELKFSNGAFVETGYGFSTDAGYVTQTDVGCRTPQGDDIQGKSIVAYSVNVTSDGTLYSPSKTIVIYDSTCMTCDANLNCVIKPQACMIDGKCRAANEAKPSDQTYMCDPHTNNTEWTHRGMGVNYCHHHLHWCHDICQNISSDRRRYASNNVRIYRLIDVAML
ncbi:hypothetical protein ACJMK2_018158 [Sinanodonta woodiana]|uniref:VWFD domain-containing protein n=1 Tax=Sinanodonta woodiana TaxID=1069815 RepID=A0ABD3UCM3_SINWO